MNIERQFFPPHMRILFIIRKQKNNKPISRFDRLFGKNDLQAVYTKQLLRTTLTSHMFSFKFNSFLFTVNSKFFAFIDLEYYCSWLICDFYKTYMVLHRIQHVVVHKYQYFMQSFVLFSQFLASKRVGVEWRKLESRIFSQKQKTINLLSQFY